MALTPTEEALVRQLLDQQAAILSLAGNEATITSKLGATKVTLSDLLAASSVGDTDLFLTRQGTTDKSVTASVLKSLLASFKQPDSDSVTRTYSDKLSDIVNAADFGAVGDGVTDDTLSIQAAIDAIQTRGGGAVFLNEGTFKVSSTLTITKSNTLLIGAGGDMPHDGGTGSDAATKIKWAGAINGTVVNVRTVAGVGNSKVYGSAVRDLEIDGSALAGIGLLVYSIFGSRFENVLSWNCRVCSYKLVSYIAGTIAEAADLQNCRFINCTYRNIDSAEVQGAHGFWLTSDNPGAAGANVSFNKFENCDGQVYTGRGWIYEDADNNINIQPRVVRVTTTNPGIEIRGTTNTDSNHFINPSIGGGTANGIRILGTASGYTQNPQRCSFYMYDNGNGTQPPQLDAGCKVVAVADHGVWEKPKAHGMVLSDGVADALSLAALLGNESLRIRNNSDNHMLLQDQGSALWSFSLQNSSGDCRFVRLGGSGRLNLGNGADIKTLGENYFMGVQTTASAANAFLDNASSPVNRLLRSTSSVRYKKDIEDITQESAAAIYNLRPVWYRSKAEADNSEWSYYGLIAEEVAAVEPRLVHWSYLPEDYEEEIVEEEITITDEIEKDGVKSLIPRKEIVRSVRRELKEGAVKVPDGVQYERLSVLLLAELKKMRAELDKLKEKR